MLHNKKTKLECCLVVIMVILLTACGQSGQKPEAQQQSGKEKQEYDKAPDKLKSIESNVEMVFKALEGPAVIIDEKSNKSSSQSSQSQQSQSQPQQSQSQSQQQSSQSGSDSQSSKQSRGTQQNQSKSQNTKQKYPVPDPFKEIESIINNLHYQWNDYMPDVVKKSTDRKIPENFSMALNILTETAKSKDKSKTLDAANNLYASITDLYSLYRTKMSPEIKRMRYLIRSAILASTADDWLKADKNIKDLKPSWTMFKNTLDKEESDDSDKLDLSIYELEKVVAQKNLALADIKGRIALSNIAAIEKSYKKKEENS